MTTLTKLFAGLAGIILLAGFMVLALIEVLIRGGRAVLDDMEDGQ